MRLRSKYRTIAIVDFNVVLGYVAVECLSPRSTWSDNHGYPKSKNPLVDFREGSSFEAEEAWLIAQSTAEAAGYSRSDRQKPSVRSKVPAAGASIPHPHASVCEDLGDVGSSV